MPVPPATPNRDDIANELRGAGFEAEFNKEQMRYSPHLVFLKQLSRLDEAMASLSDPYPAFEAWTSGLLSWAAEDPQFWQDNDLIEALEDELFATYGGIPVLEYVGMWRPTWIGVMRRAGMFRSDPAAPQGHDQYRGRMSNKGARRPGEGAT
jgi:hypothetical protein